MADKIRKNTSEHPLSVDHETEHHEEFIDAEFATPDSPEGMHEGNPKHLDTEDDDGVEIGENTTTEEAPTDLQTEAILETSQEVAEDEDATERMLTMENNIDPKDSKTAKDLLNDIL